MKEKVILFFLFGFVFILAGCQSCDNSRPEEDQWFEIADSGEEPAG